MEELISHIRIEEIQLTTLVLLALKPRLQMIQMDLTIPKLQEITHIQLQRQLLLLTEVYHNNR